MRLLKKSHRMLPIFSFVVLGIAVVIALAYQHTSLSDLLVAATAVSGAIAVFVQMKIITGFRWQCAIRTYRTWN